MSPENMTERFEMRLGQSVLEKVDAWRAGQSDVPSRSEAVRRLVETGLALEGRAERQIKFSDGNKLILLMLCQLFKHLEVDSEIEPDFIEAVIYGGHYWALGWEYPGIFHDSQDKSQVVTEVVDILDMWSFLESGFAKLSKKDKGRVEAEAEPFGKYVTFTGFDGNNESQYCNVARFLVDKLGRFSEFKGRELNAHMPTIDTYRRMLAVFEPIRETLIGRDLNASEIIEILKTKLHPSRRKPL